MSRKSFEAYRTKIAIRKAGAFRRGQLKDRHCVAQQFRCFYCGVKFSKNNPSTFEHIIPKSKGGLDTEMNSVASCLRCNQERKTANHDAFLRYKQRSI